MREALEVWRAKVKAQKVISQLKSDMKPKVTSLMQEQVKSAKVLASKREQLKKALAHL